MTSRPSKGVLVTAEWRTTSGASVSIRALTSRATMAAGNAWLMTRMFPGPTVRMPSCLRSHLLAEELRRELLDRALGAHRRRPEQPVDRLAVERGVDRAAARKPVELAPAQREQVPVRGKRQHLLARGRGGLRGQHRNLQLALRSVHLHRLEGLERHDFVQLAGRPEEHSHVVAERLLERLLDLGSHVTGSLEHHVAARPEGRHALSADALEDAAKLLAAHPMVAPDVDRPQERRVFHATSVSKRCSSVASGSSVSPVWTSDGWMTVDDGAVSQPKRSDAGSPASTPPWPSPDATTVRAASCALIGPGSQPGSSASSRPSSSRTRSPR